MTTLNSLPNIASSQEYVSDYPLPQQRSNRRLRRPTQPSLAAIAHPNRLLKAGQSLYEAGCEASCLYVVKRGMLKAIIPTAIRDCRIADLYGEGDMLGVAALEGANHMESVIALDDCELTPLDPQQALQNRAVRNYIMNALSKQLRRSRQLLHNNELPVGARVAQLFVHLAGRFGQTVADPSKTFLPLALTHEDLACLTGSSRVTVTRILGELRQHQSLEGTRGVYTVDVHKLEQATDNYVMQVI